MATGKSVNLDAMIPREDFSIIEDASSSTDSFDRIGIRDLVGKQSLVRNHFRKPDFQRETNHWSPKQVCSLIESFIDGDLIPSIILWQSQSSPRIFVIDGGHRISALCAWVDDDYGNGLVSKTFFGDEITEAQKKSHNETQKLINKKIGSFQDWVKLNETSDLNALKLDDVQKRRLKRFSSGTIPVQWVPGDADKAESSFFKINTLGTPLDEIEELLIRYRRNPIAISARSIIRAGMGHKYWSAFPAETRQRIEKQAKEIHDLLFEPEYDTPIKTLDLPLGGVAGVRTALSLLIDFILVANRAQQVTAGGINNYDCDLTGEETIKVLDKTINLVRKMTGNDNGSLGFHPAVYFYGPSGRFSPSNFMGIAIMIANKILNNDKSFYKKFTQAREKFEDFLVKNRSLIAVISNQTRSKIRYETMAKIFEVIISTIQQGKELDVSELAKIADLKIETIVTKVGNSEQKFNDDTKSIVYINAAVSSALRCPVCKGRLSARNSVSYDHIIPVREGGCGHENNCQIVHPYCNQSVKQ